MRIVMRELRSRYGSIAEYARAIGISAAEITMLRRHMIKS
jgi:hypothetical protein